MSKESFVMPVQFGPVMDPELAHFLGVEPANFGDTDPSTITESCPNGRPFIDQNGVLPGQKKLEQFRRAFQLRNTPQLYATEDIRCDDKLIYVKLFNPCGGQTWHFAEFSRTAPDGYPDLGFSYVTGMDCDEWGYTSLEELANVKGPTGIGIEIDCWFKPTVMREIKANNERATADEGEALQIESHQR
jgi:hypothetical protein